MTASSQAKNIILVGAEPDTIIAPQDKAPTMTSQGTGWGGADPTGTTQADSDGWGLTNTSIATHGGSFAALPTSTNSGAAIISANGGIGGSNSFNNASSNNVNVCTVAVKDDGSVTPSASGLSVIGHDNNNNNNNVDNLYSFTSPTVIEPITSGCIPTPTIESKKAGDFGLAPYYGNNNNNNNNNNNVFTVTTPRSEVFARIRSISGCDLMTPNTSCVVPELADHATQNGSSVNNNNNINKELLMSELEEMEGLLAAAMLDADYDRCDSLQRRVDYLTSQLGGAVTSAGGAALVY